MYGFIDHAYSEDEEMKIGGRNENNNKHQLKSPLFLEMYIIILW